MGIEGKVALVTGAGKRIGKALALRLAGLGCHIVVHYRHSEREALEAAEAIRKKHHNAQRLLKPMRVVVPFADH